MRLLAFFLILILIYFEFSFFVYLANLIGVLPTIFLGLITTFGGIALVKKQGLQNLFSFQMRMQNQQDPANQVIKGILLMFCGVLLTLPGFITDAIGLILLIPFIQKMVVKRFVHKVKNQVFSRQQSEVIIEGEFTKESQKLIIDQDNHTPLK